MDPNHDGHANVSADDWRAPTQNVVGLSLAYQAPLSLEKEAPWGVGLVYLREYFITPRTTLGVALGARLFPNSPLHVALGYGLSFKHYVNFGSPEKTNRGLYLRYGLLMQMSVLADRSGVPSGHDTHLALGYDWQMPGISPVIEAGYHVTQVRAFERDTLWWPYSEILIGLRF